MGVMKALASALALILVGLTGVWLWVDATSDAAQDVAGVVVVSPVEPEAVSTTQAPEQDDAGADDAAVTADPDDAEATAEESTEAAEDQLQAADEVDDKVIAATVASLQGIFNGFRVGSQTLADDLRAAADQIAAEEQAADEERKAEEKAAADARKAEEQAAQQPAPLSLIHI